MEKQGYEQSIVELNTKIREGETARRKMHNTIQVTVMRTICVCFCRGLLSSIAKFGTFTGAPRKRSRIRPRASVFAK